MNRKQKRNEVRVAASFIKKAKSDMANWLAEQLIEPTEGELMAWKAGYIAGINRINNRSDNGTSN